jgi:ATP-dependent DNA helicase RecG
MHLELPELEKIIPQGEDGQNQFKLDIRSSDSIAAEMVAFSNSRGGKIFIGVADNGEVIGLTSKDVNRINQLLSNAASQFVRSPITFQTQNILVNTERVVIIVTIPEGIDKPYFDHQGVIWLKSGSDKRRIHSKEELRRLFQEVDLLHADTVPTRAKIEALDWRLFEQFFRKCYNVAPPKTAPKRLQLLKNMSLASGEQLTLAGLLLFAKEPFFHKPAFIIKAITFPGTKIGITYIDSEDFEGPLTEIFHGALLFIMRNLRKVQNNKSVNSIGDPEIPQLVFEELLVNALIHRDYFISAPIRLFVFDDRIEIISPGSLPDHLTIEKIQAGASIQRNPILTKFISDGMLPYRGLGTGVPRALESWSKIEFIDDRDGCQFTSRVHREKVEKKEALIITKVSLSDLQINILKLIEKDPFISYDELSEKTGKVRTTVRTNVQHLKSLGILQRFGATKKGYWQIDPTRT